MFLFATATVFLFTADHCRSTWAFLAHGRGTRSILTVQFLFSVLNKENRSSHTRSKIIRSSSSSSSSNCDPAPSRRWCPIASTIILSVSCTQSRPHDMDNMNLDLSCRFSKVRSGFPVDVSQTLQVPSMEQKASMLPSTDHEAALTRLGCPGVLPGIPN